MTNIRISRGLANIIGRELVGSHKTLEALFVSAGAPGSPPDLSHAEKWKTWIFQAGADPTVNSLSFLGNILEEFMDVEESVSEACEHDERVKAKQRVLTVLEANGLEYYQGGRVIPNGNSQDALRPNETNEKEPNVYPNSIDELIKTLVRGLPRAIYPLQNRRKNSTSINFTNEYDVQDFLHAMLRPWISDVRAEEYVPSYAGSNTRMDF